MIILITGMMASGKSTAAQAVAERLDPSVHLRGDAFRKMIVNGRADMTQAPSVEALQQLTLRFDASIAIARLYAQAGFKVVYQDTIIGPVLADVVSKLGDDLTQLIVLNPSKDVIALREQSRSKTGYAHYSVEALAEVFAQTQRLGYWLDNTAQSVEETADEIYRQIASA